MVGGPSFLTAKKEPKKNPECSPKVHLSAAGMPPLLLQPFVVRNDDTDPPLSPLPTEGGEENITRKSVADRQPALNGLALSNPSQATIGAQTEDRESPPLASPLPL